MEPRGGDYPARGSAVDARRARALGGRGARACSELQGWSPGSCSELKGGGTQWTVRTAARESGRSVSRPRRAGFPRP